jgi:hypothetical protein
MRKYSRMMIGIFIVTLGFLASAQNSITVSGTVIDNATVLPVEGAMVLLFGTNSYPTSSIDLSTVKLDTAITGADGTFSRTMTVESSASFLGCGIKKEGFEYMFRCVGISTTIELGITEIFRSEIEGILTRPGVSFVKNQPDAVQICSLDGKQHYNGPIALLKNTVLNRSGVAMVTFKRNNTIIDKRRLFFTR